MVEVILTYSCDLQSKDTINPVTLWNSIFLGSLILGFLFTACEIGERLSDMFDEIGYEVDKFNWYLFPVEIQRMMPTILIGVQRPIVVGCFGIFSCSREQFKMVKFFLKQLNEKQFGDVTLIIFFIAFTLGDQMCV